MSHHHLQCSDARDVYAVVATGQLDRPKTSPVLRDAAVVGPQRVASPPPLVVVQRSATPAIKVPRAPGHRPRPRHGPVLEGHRAQERHDVTPGSPRSNLPVEAHRHQPRVSSCLCAPEDVNVIVLQIKDEVAVLAVHLDAVPPVDLLEPVQDHVLPPRAPRP